MKKFFLNEWTFVISLLSIISVCFISTGFRCDDYGSIVINFFGSLLLISLVMSTLFTDLSKKIKYVVYGFMLVCLVFSMSSCGVTRDGCPDTRNYIGYK